MQNPATAGANIDVFLILSLVSICNFAFNKRASVDSSILTAHKGFHNIDNLLGNPPKSTNAVRILLCSMISVDTSMHSLIIKTSPSGGVFSFQIQAKNCRLTVKRMSLRPEFLPLVLRGFTAIEGDRCPNQ